MSPGCNYAMYMHQLYVSSGSPHIVPCMSLVKICALEATSTVSTQSPLARPLILYTHAHILVRNHTPRCI